jgi:hypothetical protein
LSYEQIYDYFENAIIVAPGEDFKPLGLFQDIHCELSNIIVNFITTKELKCHIKQLFNGNSCIKTMILPHTYQTCFLKLQKY